MSSVVWNRAVLDTNVLFSAYGYGGAPAALLKVFLVGGHTLVTSPALLTELGRVLPRHHAFDHERTLTVVTQLVEVCEIVRPKVRIDVASDDADNRVLECAVEAAADVIVSGDRHLLALGSHEGIEIVTVAEALERLGIEEVAL